MLAAHRSWNCEALIPQIEQGRVPTAGVPVLVTHSEQCILCTILSEERQAGKLRCQGMLLCR
jgi:hypothetical protein